MLPTQKPSHEMPITSSNVRQVSAVLYASKFKGRCLKNLAFTFLASHLLPHFMGNHYRRTRKECNQGNLQDTLHEWPAARLPSLSLCSSSACPLVYSFGRGRCSSTSGSIAAEPKARLPVSFLTSKEDTGVMEDNAKRG